MKKLFITGGLGYIGSVLAQTALKKGYKVVLYDSLMYEQNSRKLISQILGKKSKSLVKLIVGDTRNKDLLDISIKNEVPDFVFHLAELSSVYSCEHNPPMTHDINFVGSKNVIDVCVKYNIPTIYNSSSSVYGSQKNIHLMKEHENLPKPTDKYCEYKLLMEKYIKQILKKHPGYKIIVFRPATICGVSPRMRVELLPNHFTYCAVSKKVIKISEPDSHRAAMDIKDLVSGYMKVIKSKKLVSGVYNIGHFNFSKREYASKIKEIVPCEISPMESFGDLRNLQIDCTKFEREYAFRPNVLYAQTIKEVSKWIKSNLKVMEKTNFNGVLNMSLDLWRKIT